MTTPLRHLRRRRGSWLMSDNCYDTPEIRALRRRLWAGRGLEVAQEQFKACTNPNDRHYLAEACADWYDRPKFITSWIPSKSPDELLVKGIHALKWAWRARGAGWVPQNFEEFQRRLRDAEIYLKEAAAIAPRDAVPWAWLISVYRGMQSLSSGEAAFREAVARAPGLRYAYTSMLVSKSPSWGGTRQGVEDFVWESLSKARRGTSLETLNCEMGTMLPRSVPEMKMIWSSPQMAAAVRESNTKYFRAPRFTETIHTLRDRNWFANALTHIGDFDAAWEHFEVIGSVPQIMPWGQMHPIAEWLFSNFKRQRRRCARG